MHDVQEPELLHDEEPAQAPRAGRVEEVLPALQQADGAQGVEVMTTAALEPHGQGWLRRAWDFVAVQVPAEVRKVTWSSWDELKKATGGIVGFGIFLGVVLGVKDLPVPLVFGSGVGRLFK